MGEGEAGLVRGSMGGMQEGFAVWGSLPGSDLTYTAVPPAMCCCCCQAAKAKIDEGDNTGAGPISYADTIFLAGGCQLRTPSVVATCSMHSPCSTQALASLQLLQHAQP